MEKRKIYEFTHPFSSCNLWVTVGVPFDELKEEFEGIKEMPEGVVRVIGYTVKLRPEMTHGVLVRYKNIDAITSISHDSPRIAFKIIRRIGRTAIDTILHDSFAKLCDWVVQCIEKVKQIEIEHSKQDDVQNDNTGTEREEAGS